MKSSTEGFSEESLALLGSAQRETSYHIKLCIMDFAGSEYPHLMAAFLQIFGEVKWLGVRKVVEIRDLWPESIVEYGIMPGWHPAVQALYKMERWMYRNVDASNGSLSVWKYGEMRKKI